jgi:hypothetical protein
MYQLIHFFTRGAYTARITFGTVGAVYILRISYCHGQFTHTLGACKKQSMANPVEANRFCKPLFNGLLPYYFVELHQVQIWKKLAVF